MLDQRDFQKIPMELKWRNWLILLGLVGASLFFMSWRFTLGVLVGGVLANVNFYFLHKTLINLLISQRAPKGLVPRSILRLFVLGVILAILLKQDWLDVFGLLLGLSVVVINFFVITLTEIKSLVLDRR